MDTPEMKNLDSDNGLINLAKWLICRLTWKLVAQLATVTLLCGISYFAWETRWKISSIAVSKWAVPEINQDRLPALVEGLVNDVDPKAIMAWSANVGGDTRTRYRRSWLRMTGLMRGGCLSRRSGRMWIRRLCLNLKRWRKSKGRKWLAIDEKSPRSPARDMRAKPE